MTPNEVYTAEVLAVVCPKCKGVGQCLDPSLWGSKYIDKPHAERVTSTALKVKKCCSNPDDCPGTGQPCLSLGGAGFTIEPIKTACVSCSEQGLTECLYGGPCDRVNK